MSCNYDYEVLTRRMCDVQECQNGRIHNENSKKFPWSHCSNCNGKGHVEEWIDLKTLIRQMINV